MSTSTYNIGFISSINITLNMEQRLRRKLRNEEDAKLSREIRSVAPTSSNDIITTRATYGRSNAGNRVYTKTPTGDTVRYSFK